ncbi:MAG TPA: 4-(cytidine 5'-diphospho)-2-C-methyl-D-erythritol kinase [Candidatus Eremiobacteraceae bacterium]
MAAWTRAFRLKARAKLNLTLYVGAVLPNGLHELRSLAASLTLADDVLFEPHDGDFGVICEGLDIPERDNLAFRAAAALGVKARGVRIRVGKRIPARAGLGGGSADAAAALIGLARISREGGSVEYSDAELNAAAAALGSDVPACLLAGFKAIAGTGDLVHPLSIASPPWGVALLKPADGLSTEVAYKLIDTNADDLQRSSESIARRDRSGDLSAHVRSGMYAEFCKSLHNDFDSMVRRDLPDVARAHDRLRSAGADATMLCGSGSTVAGIFRSVADAEAALARIALARDEWSAAAGFSDGE